MAYEFGTPEWVAQYEMAIGEQPAMRHSERANKMLKFMSFGLPKMVSPRRTWVKT